MKEKNNILEITIAMKDLALFHQKTDFTEKEIDNIRQIDENLSQEELYQQYNILKNIIDPLTPLEALEYIQLCNKDNYIRRIFNTNRILFKLVVSCIFFLIMFSAVSTSILVNEDSITKSILTSSGENLFINLLLIISVSGIGASFSTFSAYISATSIKEKLNCNFLSVIKGVLSGFIMSEIIIFWFIEGQNMLYLKLLFAFLGGMTSSIVLEFIDIIKESLITLISGGNKRVFAKRKERNIKSLTSVFNMIDANSVGDGLETEKLKREINKIFLND